MTSDENGSTWVSDSKYISVWVGDVLKIEEAKCLSSLLNFLWWFFVDLFSPSNRESFKYSLLMVPWRTGWETLIHSSWANQLAQRRWSSYNVLLLSLIMLLLFYRWTASFQLSSCFTYTNCMTAKKHSSHLLSTRKSFSRSEWEKAELKINVRRLGAVHA